MYRGCIFDLDGTLADTLQSIAGFGNSALQQLGLAPIEPQLYRQLVGDGADTLILRMLAQSGGDPLMAPRLRAIYDDLYESNPLHLVTPYPHIVQELLTLSTLRVQMAVLSNKPDNMTRAIVQAIFPQIRFTQVVGQRFGVPKKPDPAAVRALLDKMQLRPRQVLYVGDSGVDMDTGRAAELDTAGVLWGFRQKEELLEHGAKFLVESPKQLTDLVLKPR